MGSRRNSPVLLANVIFSAIVVGIVAGVAFRATTGDPIESSVQKLLPGGESVAAPSTPEASGETQAEPLSLALQSTESTAQAPQPSTTLPQRLAPHTFSFADVADQVAPAVVTVRSSREISRDDPSGFFERFFGGRDQPIMRGHGSGFILESDGIILTNNHVVDDATELVVRLMDGREFKGEVVGTDPQSDLAVLRIDATDLPTVRLGDSDQLRVGDWVLAIGSPFQQALEHSVTAGIISGKGRANVGLADYEEFLQTDAAINPGNSGGPLINLEGAVVGINTAIATRNGGFQGVSFAIPINFARNIVRSLVTEGRVVRAWLGVIIQDVTPELARGLELPSPEGVAIAEVNEGSPAESAGLKSGDVIIAMDGEPTRRTSLFRNRVSLSRPGQRVKLEVLRDGKKRTFEVELGELTDEIAQAATGRRSPGSLEAPSAHGLGIELAEITPEIATRFDLSDRIQGVVVVDVRSGSEAASAGLQPGDVVRAVNRRDVESIADFESAVERVPVNHPLVLNVKRGNQSFFLTLERAS